MEQEPLAGFGETVRRRTGDGLYRRYVDSQGEIIMAAWLRACAGAEVVGSCRECGGDLMPSRPTPGHGGGTRPDYLSVCRECGKELVAACGRTIRWNGERGKKRRLPTGLVGIAKDAATGQNRDDAL